MIINKWGWILGDFYGIGNRGFNIHKYSGKMVCFYEIILNKIDGNFWNFPFKGGI